MWLNGMVPGAGGREERNGARSVRYARDVMAGSAGRGNGDAMVNDVERRSRRLKVGGEPQRGGDQRDDGQQAEDPG